MDTKVLNIILVLKSLYEEDGATRERLMLLTGLGHNPINEALSFMINKGAVKKIRKTEGKHQHIRYYLLK